MSSEISIADKQMARQNGIVQPLLTGELNWMERNLKKNAYLLFLRPKVGRCF